MGQKLDELVVLGKDDHSNTSRILYSKISKNITYEGYIANLSSKVIKMNKSPKQKSIKVIAEIFRTE